MTIGSSKLPDGELNKVLQYLEGEATTWQGHLVEQVERNNQKSADDDDGMELRCVVVE